MRYTSIDWVILLHEESSSMCSSCGCSLFQLVKECQIINKIIANISKIQTHQIIVINRYQLFLCIRTAVLTCNTAIKSVQCIIIVNVIFSSCHHPHCRHHHHHHYHNHHLVIYPTCDFPIR